MSKVRSIISVTISEGISGLLHQMWDHLFLTSFASGLIKSILGEIYHQKIWMSPKVGYWPKIKNPRSFNEHIMNRKLCTDNDLYTTVSDKWGVRDFIRAKDEEQILNQVYDVYSSADDISFESLPNSFVIKANHGQGWNKLIRDKQEEEQVEIRALCDSWLSKDFGAEAGEYWYGNIEPRIIVENYLAPDGDRVAPLDYKFWVFGGTVEYVDVDFDRYSEHKIRFYDRDWTPLDFMIGFPLGPVIEPPDDLDEMIRIAEKLAQDFEFARIDLYSTDSDGIVFGEITLAPSSGGGRFEPLEYDFRLGKKWIKNNLTR